MAKNDEPLVERMSEDEVVALGIAMSRRVVNGEAESLT